MLGTTSISSGNIFRKVYPTPEFVRNRKYYIFHLRNDIGFKYFINIIRIFILKSCTIACL